MEARGELLTIFDAEDIPERDELRRAASMLKAAPARTACLQARLAIDNTRDSLLARLFALEYAGLFDVINPGLTRSGLPFLLGGTSNHFRTQALRDIGGWDAWNVTEDADLAIRLVRAGWRMGDCAATTWEEAPVSLGPWMRQRRRWMKGFVQCAITHGRQPLRALSETGLINGVALVALSLGTVASALFYPPFLILAGYALATGGWSLAASGIDAMLLSLSLTLFIAGHVAIFAPPLIGGLRRRNHAALVALPLMPAYLVLISIAAWWALIDLTRAPFHWHKTEHGLGRRKPGGEDTAKAASANRQRPSPMADRH
jgi:cellulose synthase/poly-beta-1,6-N-acetylglucosamine synthase-like glycosyltransferase